MRRFASAAAVKAVSTAPYTTKGNPIMKHLDVYARRDVQLAPYLLREVDIEYKRKCQKVSFCLWLALTVAMGLFSMQLYGEQVEVMMNLAELVHRENEARDEDFLIRRRLFAKYLAIIKESFARDQKWTDADTFKVSEMFTKASSEAS